ncbi:MAG: DNA primase [Bacteroidales bacterium]|nr:DNA primase [Bacteroidales bacterium]
MIPKETVDLILDTAKIEEVIGDYVTLKRRGGNFVACCPFHNEKTPSFYVSPSKGIYKCFGCGKAGSAVGFIMEYEHQTYPEALRTLARKYNIEIVEKEETAEEIAAREHSESLHLVCDRAEKFFVESLQTREGRSLGYQYFRSRGLEDETIAKYGLGWSPSSRHDFTDLAKKEGYKDEYLVDSGLSIKRDDGSLYDRFFERVMFPFHTVGGRIVGFGGRTLRSDKTVAKYVNSPETEIYIKNRILYGLYFAKNDISKEDKCYLVEGYLDVLSMHQLGILNVVASSGTSLTEGQILLIKRFTENVTIMYDGDSAGIHAALRGINMILREGMNVKIVLLPDGDDPDSFARKHTLEEVKAFIASAERDFIGFKTDLLLEEAGSDPLKRANLINDIADTIAEIPDAVKRAMYISDCASKFGISEDILYDRVRVTRERISGEAQREKEREARRVSEPVVTPQAEYRPTVKDPLVDNPVTAPSEEELLSLLIRHGTDFLSFETDSPYFSDEPLTVAEFIDEGVDPAHTPFLNKAYKAVYEAYFALYDEGKTQERIVMDLLNGEDRVVASVAARLAEPSHQLTMKKYADSLTATDSWLAKSVPMAILSYQEKVVDVHLLRLKRDLAEASPEKSNSILMEISSLMNTKRLIAIRLGKDNDLK